MKYIRLNERLTKLNETSISVNFKDREDFLGKSFEVKNKDFLNNKNIHSDSLRIITSYLYDIIKQDMLKHIPTRKRPESIYVNKGNILYLNYNNIIINENNKHSLNAFVDIINYYLKCGFDIHFVENSNIIITIDTKETKNSFFNTLNKIKGINFNLIITDYKNTTIFDNNDAIEFYNRAKTITVNTESNITDSKIHLYLADKSKITHITAKNTSLTYYINNKKEHSVSFVGNPNNNKPLILTILTPKATITNLTIEDFENTPLVIDNQHGNLIINRLTTNDLCIVNNINTFIENKNSFKEEAIKQKIDSLLSQNDEIVLPDGNDFVESLSEKYGKFIFDKNIQLSELVNNLIENIKNISGRNKSELLKNNISYSEITVNMLGDINYRNIGGKLLMNMVKDLIEYLENKGISVKINCYQGFNVNTFKINSDMMDILAFLTKRLENNTINLNMGDVSILNDTELLKNIIDKKMNIYLKGDKGNLNINANNDLEYSELRVKGNINLNLNTGIIFSVKISSDSEGVFGNYKFKNTTIKLLEIEDVKKYSNPIAPEVIFDNSKILDFRRPLISPNISQDVKTFIALFEDAK